MMKPFFIAAAMAFAGLAALPPFASAQSLSLEQAQDQGLVGERPDGLVAPVADDPSQEVRRLVTRINDKRMAEYRKVASDTNASLKAVQARAGRQIISRLSKGEYFTDAAGNWRRK